MTSALSPTFCDPAGADGFVGAEWSRRETAATATAAASTATSARSTSRPRPTAAAYDLTVAESPRVCPSESSARTAT